MGDRGTGQHVSRTNYGRSRPALVRNARALKTLRDTPERAHPNREAPTVRLLAVKLPRVDVVNVGSELGAG